MKYKKISIIISVLVILLFFYVGYKFIVIHKYKSNVDSKLYDKLLIMENNKIQYQKNILFTPDISRYPDNELMWGDKKVRLRSENIKTTDGNNNIAVRYDIIQTKSQIDSDWKNLITKQEPFCHEGIIGQNKLLCLSASHGDIILNIIDNNGKFITKTLVSTPNYGEQTVFADDKYMYIIWTDWRLQWPNPIKIITNNPETALSGPFIVMAGKLNLDTLEFQEQVIKYNSDFFP